jgi:hypothetical protein
MTGVPTIWVSYSFSRSSLFCMFLHYKTVLFLGHPGHADFFLFSCRLLLCVCVPQRGSLQACLSLSQCQSQSMRCAQQLYVCVLSRMEHACGMVLQQSWH